MRHKIEATSPHAVTVPGAIEAWEVILKTHGRFGLDPALQPAIRHAEDGFPVAPRVASDWATFAGKLAPHKGSAKYYLVDGGAPEVGHKRIIEIIRNHTSDVVFAKDLRIHLDTISPPCAKCSPGVRLALPTEKGTYGKQFVRVAGGSQAQEPAASLMTTDNSHPVAIVTGAGSSGENYGTGQATAILFAREGAKVVLVDISKERAQVTLATKF